MVELKKKYKIGVRRFSLINWIGFYSLYKKETLRFLIVSGQTILGPVVTAFLFLLGQLIYVGYGPAYYEKILGWMIIDDETKL